MRKVFLLISAMNDLRNDMECAFHSWQNNDFHSYRHQIGNTYIVVIAAPCSPELLVSDSYYVPPSMS